MTFDYDLRYVNRRNQRNFTTSKFLILNSKLSWSVCGIAIM